MKGIGQRSNRTLLGLEFLCLLDEEWFGVGEHLKRTVVLESKGPG